LKTDNQPVNYKIYDRIIEEYENVSIYKSIGTLWLIGCQVYTLSAWHRAFSGCGLRRQPPAMEGSCEYTE